MDPCPRCVRVQTYLRGLSQGTGGGGGVTFKAGPDEASDVGVMAGPGLTVADGARPGVVVTGMAGPGGWVSTPKRARQGQNYWVKGLVEPVQGEAKGPEKGQGQTPAPGR